MESSNQQQESRRPVLLNIALWGIIIALLIVLFSQYENIIKPLFIALFFWYLIKGLKNSLAKIKINGKALPKPARGFLAFVIIVLFITLVVEVISINVRQISSHIRDYDDKIDALSEQIVNNIEYNSLLEEIQNIVEEIDFRSLATKTANTLSNFVADFVVVMIYLIFMLLEEIAVQLKVEKLFPNKGEDYKKLLRVSKSINTSIQSYFVSKTIISFVLGLACFVVMKLYGLEFALLWAFIIFLFNFIPYIGSLIATLLPSLFAVIQFGDGWYFVYIFASIEFFQILMANVVEPKLMGKSLNLSPITVLVSLAFWGSLWGIAGLVLAVPVTAIIMVILAHFPSTRYLAVLLSERGNID